MVAAEGLTAALHRRDGLATWRVAGTDRVDYLHRMLTQDVRALAIGHGAYACFLTIKGRILGDLLLWNVGDHLLLELEAAAVPAVMPSLERFVIADDVVLEDVTALGVRYALVGPEATATLTRAGLEVPPANAFVEVACGGHPARILRFDRRGLSTYEIAVAPPAAAALEERLAVTQGTPHFEAACVAHGIPRFGHELGQDVLFNEAGLEEAVSWSKGCFPGQEPVVMARHRGRPPRLLVRLRLDAGVAPAPGALVRADGETVGHVTSATAGAALAYVKYAAALDGATYDIEGGGRAIASLSTPAGA